MSQCDQQGTSFLDYSSAFLSGRQYEYAASCANRDVKPLYETSLSSSQQTTRDPNMQRKYIFDSGASFSPYLLQLTPTIGAQKEHPVFAFDNEIHDDFPNYIDQKLNKPPLLVNHSDCDSDALHFGLDLKTPQSSLSSSTSPSSGNFQFPPTITTPSPSSRNGNAMMYDQPERFTCSSNQTSSKSSPQHQDAPILTQQSSCSVAFDLLPELSSTSSAAAVSTNNIGHDIPPLQNHHDAKQPMIDPGIEAFDLSAVTQQQPMPDIDADVDAGLSLERQLRCMSQTPATPTTSNNSYVFEHLGACSEVPSNTASNYRVTRSNSRFQLQDDIRALPEANTSMQDEFDTKMSLDFDSELNRISSSGYGVMRLGSTSPSIATRRLHGSASRVNTGPTSIPTYGSASPSLSSSSSSSSTAPSKRGRKKKVKAKRDRSVKNMSPERLERVRLLGRLAARRSRARKKAEIEDLEKEGARLSEEKTKLLNEKEQLSANIIMLQQAIRDRARSGALKAHIEM